jgi:hypothetical protein
LQQRFKQALSIFLAAGSLSAHHSPSAEFDMSKRFTLAGTLTKVDWINPHIVVNVEAKGEGGKLESWRFESNPPSWFRRVGVSRSEIARGIGSSRWPTEPPGNWSTARRNRT